MEIIDYVSLSKSRTTSLFENDAVYEAFIQAVVEILAEKQLEVQSLETSLFNIDLSVGVQLDLIGKIVGQDRNLVLFTADPFFGFVGGRNAQAFDVGTWRSILKDQTGTNKQLDDPSYRTVLKARIASNGSRATYNDCLAVINLLANNTTTKIENGSVSGNATIVVTEPSPLLLYFLSQLDKPNSLIPIPLGVKIKVEIV
mgnify:CR=1 FL=1